MCIEFQHCQVVVIKGLAYLLTYFIAVVIDLKVIDYINFGIYWKNLLSHSRRWPWPWNWVCGLGLGLGLPALALTLTPLALLTSLHLRTNMN